jgi:anti-sigma B factor antagonist
MFDNEFHNYSISDYPLVCVIELGQSVLGGPDALNFTDLLENMGNNFKHILIDMQKVEIINSSGLGMLISAVSTLRKFDVSFSLVRVPGKVDNIFKMTHLDKIFQVDESIEEALKKLIIDN